MKHLSLIGFFLLFATACTTTPSSDSASRDPAAYPKRLPEKLVLKEGENIKCVHWKNPYRTNQFELKFDNPSKTYRLIVNTMEDSDSKKMTHLKTFQNKPLWCVFAENKTFACSTQNLRDKVDFDPKAPAFYFTRFAQTSLTEYATQHQRDAFVDFIDYLDVQFTDASSKDLDYAVVEEDRYFPLSSCQFKSSGWF